MPNNKLLVLGLGNQILSDDAAGIIVAKKIYETLQNLGLADGVEFRESACAGWRLIDLFAGYAEVVIIDTFFGQDAVPGEVYEIDNSNACTVHLQSSHGMGLLEALVLARQSGVPMPRLISIYGIGVNNPDKFGETLSPEIEQKLPTIVEEIVRAIRQKCRLTSRMEIEMV